MENVVNIYLHMALVGTILILAVLAMRPIIKKFSNRMVCCLWAVVLFRLLCPITFGIGLIPLPEIAKGKDVIENEAYIEDMHTEDMHAEIVHAENAYTENADTVDTYTRNLDAINPDTMDLVATDSVVKTEQNESKQSVVEQAVTNLPVAQETATKEALAKENAVLENVTKLSVGKEAVNEMTTKEESVTAPTYATDTMIEKAPVSQKIMDPTSIIFGIWMVGALLVLAVGIRKYFRLNKGLREAIPYGTHGKYKVKKCSIPEAPMSFGIFHPIIYVPLSFGENSGEDPALERQQEMILTHEQMHLKHHDPLWKALVFVVLAVY